MAAEIKLATIDVDENKTAKLADRLQAEEKRRRRPSTGRRGCRNSRPSSPHWTSNSRTPDSGVERSRVTSSETELTTREGEKCCELSWPARKSHVTNCNIN